MVEFKDRGAAGGTMCDRTGLQGRSVGSTTSLWMSTLIGTAHAIPATNTATITAINLHPTDDDHLTETAWLAAM